MEDAKFKGNKKISFKLGTFIKDKILKKYGIIKNKNIDVPKNDAEPIDKKENDVKNLLPHDENMNI